MGKSGRSYGIQLGEAWGLNKTVQPNDIGRFCFKLDGLKDLS